MKHTPEEISLCKQVAKRHRKEIKKGDWYNDLNVVGGNLDLCDRNAGFYYRYLNENEKIVPLWTISDCLEFLIKRVNQIDIGQIKGEVSYCYIYDGFKGIEETREGKTLLEACLKAALVVLEEEE